VPRRMGGLALCRLYGYADRLARLLRVDFVEVYEVAPLRHGKRSSPVVSD
jgi:hypothetical protein